MIDIKFYIVQMGDYTFVYKLWLCKSLPWIQDVSFYFTNVVCKQFANVIENPLMDDYIDGEFMHNGIVWDRRGCNYIDQNRCYIRSNHFDMIFYISFYNEINGCYTVEKLDIKKCKIIGELIFG